MSVSISQLVGSFADSVIVAPGLSVQITQLAPETDVNSQADALDVALTQAIAFTVAVPAAPLGVAMTIGPAASVIIDLPGAGGSSGSYENPAYPALQTVNEALDYLLYVPPVISGFSNNIGAVEIGGTVSAATLSWSFNKTMTSVTLNGNAISPALTAEALSGLSLTASTTWTLNASDGINNTIAATSVSFLAKRWWGTSTLTSLGSSDILALGGSEFATGRAQSRSMTASAAYLYFAWPSSFGAASFTVNGLPSTAWIKATVSATNASGYTQNYDVYRSQYLQNGSGIAVVVS